MPSSLPAFVPPAVLAAITSLIVAGAVRFAMLRRGIVVAPRADRWHRVPTPTYGGVGILAGFAVAIVASGALVIGTAPIMGCCIALFIVGLYDDWNPLSALAKMVASLAVAAFFVMTLTGAFPSPIQAVVIVAAIVGFGGLDNAVNLLDNMDGLAATVSATAAIGLAVTFHAEFDRAQLVVLASLTGALLGFLWWNRHPARQFMGNCGSLAVGGVLAACATIAIVRSGTLESIVAAGLVLVVPIFDSTFVVLLRRLAGRSTTRGNIDHSSHRLVSTGFSDVAAVLSLNVLGAIGATVGYVLHHHVGPAWLLASIFAVGVCLLALAIARIPAYAGQDFRALQDARFAPLIHDLTFRWHAGEVLLDVALITICYYAGYRIRFEGDALSAFLGVFSRSLPAIIGCQLAGLYLSGLYGRMWRTFGLPDLWTVIRAVGIGLILSVLTVTYVYKFETFSRSVFLFDGALLIAAIVVSRMSLRVFGHLAANVDSQRRRTAIYGAGTRGQLLAREFSVDPAWGRIAVAFIDDDAWKIGRRFVGVPVRGGIDDLGTILRDKRIEEVLISTARIGPEMEQRLRAHCARADIQVRRLHLEIT